MELIGAPIDFLGLNYYPPHYFERRLVGSAPRRDAVLTESPGLRRVQAAERSAAP